MTESATPRGLAIIHWAGSAEPFLSSLHYLRREVAATAAVHFGLEPGDYRLIRRDDDLDPELADGSLMPPGEYDLVAVR